MNWKDIWAAVSSLVGGLQEADKWKLSIDGVRSETIPAVEAGEQGIKFTLLQGRKPVTIEAVPGEVKHAVVRVNGNVEPNAKLVFALRHQLLKPFIVVFEFRNVTLNGKTGRYRFDHPK